MWRWITPRRLFPTDVSSGRHGDRALHGLREDVAGLSVLRLRLRVVLPRRVVGAEGQSGRDHLRLPLLGHRAVHRGRGEDNGLLHCYERLGSIVGFNLVNVWDFKEKSHFQDTLYISFHSFRWYFGCWTPSLRLRTPTAWRYRVSCSYIAWKQQRFKTFYCYVVDII